MIVGIGTDLLDVGRMARELARDGAGFRDDVFTPAEIAYCEAHAHPARHFAVRFAAKEACWKALGYRRKAASPLRDVEVVKPEAGPPRLVLAGRAKEEADRLGVQRALVSLSHTSTLARRASCSKVERCPKGDPDEERRNDRPGAPRAPANRGPAAEHRLVGGGEGGLRLDPRRARARVGPGRSRSTSAGTSRTGSAASAARRSRLFSGRGPRGRNAATPSTT